MVAFVHPKHQTPLELHSDCWVDPGTGDCFPIVQNIPRFCPSDNYSKSFGFQWSRFDQTQLDGYSGVNQSQQRFYGETGWVPEELVNCSVLEVGSGAGRFSEVFLRTTKGVLHSIDYSSAVDINQANNTRYGDRLRLAQASIYELPFPDDSFDKVFCLGVLQHTPSFEDSVAALIRKTRVGGEIVVDFYAIRGWYTKIHAKYILRPITKRLPKGLLLKLIRRNIRWLLALFDLLCTLKLGAFTRFIPITDVRGFPSSLSILQRREWAVLDTFDMFSPEYDCPQRIEAVENMFRRNNTEIKFAGVVDFDETTGRAAVIRAVKRG